MVHYLFWELVSFCCCDRGKDMTEKSFGTPINTTHYVMIAYYFREGN